MRSFLLEISAEKRPFLFSKRCTEERAAPSLLRCPNCPIPHSPRYCPLVPSASASPSRSASPYLHPSSSKKGRTNPRLILDAQHVITLMFQLRQSHTSTSTPSNSPSVHSHSFLPNSSSFAHPLSPTLLPTGKKYPQPPFFPSFSSGSTSSLGAVAAQT